jgi:hypothetical protein
MVCFFFLSILGHTVAQWLMSYATNRRVADSRPDEVNAFFRFRLILPAVLDSGVYTASNINKYQIEKNNISGEKSTAGALRLTTLAHG